MKLLTAIVTLGLGVTVPAAEPSSQASVIVVIGASGDDAFSGPFAKQAADWEKAAAAAGAKATVIGREAAGRVSDRTPLEESLATEPKDGPEALWLVLVGHGTFDGREARFNLRGDDVTAADLAAWLEPFRRPVAVVVATSASAPFLSKLSAPGRVVVTATRSGNEQNYSRFGEQLAPALTEPASDLDEDGRVSLLEAFLSASAKVDEFYRTEGRLATEHALIDDNGDGFGTPASWFRGLRATKKPRDAKALDGLRAHQWQLSPDPVEQARPAEWRARRDAAEAAIAALRDEKTTLAEDEYYRRLDGLLLDLARLYQADSP